MTAEKFLAVLKGDDSTAGGPVLQSNKDSTVFVFYSGVGYGGAVSMPARQNLAADELVDAINYMGDHNMYKEMVIYWASDYASAMF